MAWNVLTDSPHDGNPLCCSFSLLEISRDGLLSKHIKESYKKEVVSPKEERVAFREHWRANERKGSCCCQGRWSHKVITSKFHWTTTGRSLTNGNVPEMLSKERSRADIHRVDTLGLNWLLGLSFYSEGQGSH